ncbi:MAG: MFS transporter [Thermoplasmata archaeon]|nr:MFS transporter [Thermoplasmata archaeon]
MKAESINMLSNAAIFSSLLLISLIAEDFGASPSEIGLIVAAYSIANFASSYIFGRLSDIHGRRFFLISGLAISAIACTTQYFAYDTFTLLIARIFTGFASGIFPAALLAYAYESKHRMNKFLAWGSGGWGFGTVIGGVVATVFTMHTPFLFSAVLMVLAVPIALRMPFTKDVNMSVPLFPVKIIKRNISVYAPVLVRHTGACAIWVMYPIFIRGLDGSGTALLFWIGVVYGINSFTQFIVISRLKRKSSVLIPLGLALSIGTFISFTFCDSIWLLMPTQVVLAAAWALIYVGSIKFIMAHNEERATAAGFLNSVLQMSAILGSIIGGLIIDWTGSLLAPMWLAAGMTLVSLIMYYGLIRYQGLGKKRLVSA